MPTSVRSPRSSAEPPRARVRRVLVLRPDNLGDVVLFSGALRHLRALYPGAEITLCVRAYVVPFVERSPHVDRVVSWEELYSPLPRWVPHLRGRGPLEALARRALVRLRHRPDVVLVPVRSPSESMHRVVRVSGARESYGIAGDLNAQTAGQDRAADAVYTRRLRVARERVDEHELSTTRDFLAMLGAEVRPGELWPELWTDARDRRWAEASVPRAEGSPVLGICPGVTAPVGKLYPVESYVRALDDLAGAGLTVVLMGSPADAPVCAELAEALAGHPSVASLTNLCGRSTIREMVEGLRRCDAVLSADSAALHLAVALGKPTVGILGGGHYGRFQPWGDPVLNRICNVPMACYGCNWTCIYPVTRCVRDISPALVARELTEVLALAANAPASPR